MFFKVKSYFSFLIKSFTQKKIKSQPITDLKRVLSKEKTSLNKINTYNKYKQELATNKSIIEVTDFGAGSSVFSSNKRQVSKIAQVAGISSKQANILFKIIDFFQSKSILEIGTSLGLATSVLAIENEKSNITTLEGCLETAKIAQQQFDKFNFKNINLIIGNFSETLPKAIKNSTFDLIYFDGNHQKEATLEYFNLCLPTATNNSIFIFDDIYWSKEMQEAWREIKNHPKVTTSIDTFQWGIVFFKKEIDKKHYTVRL